jgi:multiple antibiotic resistance protein
MGIPLRAFQVAGGILLLLYAIQLTTSPTTLGATPDREGGDSLHALVVYPLAVPAIAGPEAMRTVRSARLRNGLSQWR